MRNPNDKFIVYVHTNKVNNKKYVGITSKKPEVRWGKEGNGYKKQKRFFNAIQKYGWDNFDHEILFEGLSLKEALKKEFEISKIFNSTLNEYGYNNAVGRGGNFYLSEETRKKYSEASSGVNNSMYGKKHGKETLLKLSENAHVMTGKENPASRAIRGTNLKTGEIIEFESASQAAKYFGLHNNSHFIECCKGKRKSCAGHTWVYID